MTKKKKIIIVISIFLSFAIVATGVYISKIINKDEIRKLVVANFERNFKNASIDLGEINYGLGLSIDLSVSKIKIREKSSEQDAIEISSVRADIPILAIITSGGIVDIIFEGIVINVKKNKVGSNIQRIFKGTSSAAVSKKAEKKLEAKNSKVTSILSDSKVNIRFQNINIYYEVEGKEGALTVDRVIIRDLGIKTKTVFDMRMKLSGAMKDIELQGDVSVVGEVNVEHFLRTDELSIKLLTVIKNFKYLDQVHMSDDIKVDSVIDINKSTEVSGTLEIGSVLSGDFKLKDSELMLSSFLIKADDALALYSRAVLESLSDTITFTNTKLELNANLKLNNPLNSIKMELKSKTPLRLVALQSDLNIGISLEKKRVQLNINDNLKKIGLTSKFNLDVLNEKMSVNNIENELVVKNIELPDGLLKPSDSIDINKESKVETKPQESKGSLSSFIPRSKSSITLENVSVFKNKVNSIILVETTSNSVDINFDKMKLGRNSEVKLNSKNTFKSNQWSGDLSVKTKQFDLSLIRPMLVGYVNELEGKLDLSAVINYKDTFKSIDYNSTVHCSELKVNSPLVKELIIAKAKRVEKLYDKLSKLEYPAQLKSFDVKSVGNLDRMKLSKGRLIGPPKTLNANFKGSLGLNNKNKTEIDVDVNDTANKLSKELKDNFGLNSLPLKIVGSGLEMDLDYGHTLKILSKSALKHQSKKQINKAKEKMKKKVKEKAKELIEGLFN